MRVTITDGSIKLDKQLKINLIKQLLMSKEFKKYVEYEIIRKIIFDKDFLDEIKLVLYSQTDEKGRSHE